MDRHERQVLLDRYLADACAFDRWEHASPELLDFRPAVADAWTMREHLAHVLDAEVNGTARLRKAVAEPESVIFAWDEMAYAARLDYAGQDIATVFTLIKTLRGWIHAEYSRWLDEDWDKYAVIHPGEGRLSLVKLLEQRIAHHAFHVPYCERNEREFPGL